MSTFFDHGSRAMLDSVAAEIDAVIPASVDVHTITLVLDGRHGEFNLVVEGGTDDEFFESVRFEGIAHRSGGVTEFKQVPV
jgi:hypothetical protein